MANKLGLVRRILIAIITFAAALQWAVVLERTWAAIWAHYKFSGYGGGGHIVVGQSTQVIFLLGSGLLVAVGYSLWRIERIEDTSRFWRGVSRLASLSILVCTLFWVVLLVSPLVSFVRA